MTRINTAMDFQQSSFTHKEVSITYFQKGSGELILFLPGGGVRALTYKKILEAFSEQYRVVAPELPCFGGSTVPKEIWGLDDYADFFDAVIDSLAASEVILIGHSLGGGIALHLAVKNSKVKKLMLIDSAGRSSGYSDADFRHRFYIQKTIFDFVHYQNTWLCCVIVKDFLANRIKNFFRWPHIVKIMKKCLSADFAGFSKIKVPTLIVWGDQDEIFSPESAQVFAKGIPDSIVKFVRGNHDWCLFKHEELVEMVGRWLEGENDRMARCREVS